MKSFISLMIILSMTAVASANHRRTPVRNLLKGRFSNIGAGANAANTGGSCSVRGCSK